MANRVVMVRKKGESPIKFREGALHEQLGVPGDKKIPASKMSAARSGRLGLLAKKRALFKKNILTGPK